MLNHSLYSLAQPSITQPTTGSNELILGFNQFLPPGVKIQADPIPPKTQDAMMMGYNQYIPYKTHQMQGQHVPHGVVPGPQMHGGQPIAGHMGMPVGMGVGHHASMQMGQGVPAVPHAAKSDKYCRSSFIYIYIYILLLLYFFFQEKDDIPLFADYNPTAQQAPAEAPSTPTSAPPQTSPASSPPTTPAQQHKSPAAAAPGAAAPAGVEAPMTVPDVLVTHDVIRQVIGEGEREGE